MAVRIGTVADAASVHQIWTLAKTEPVNGLDAWYPGGVPNWTQAQVELWLQPPFTTRISRVSNEDRVFITTIPRPLPYPHPQAGEPGEQLELWIARPSLTDARFKASTKELLIAWWADLQARAVGWGWGWNVGNYPAKTETLFQRMRTVGMTVTNIDGRRLVAMPPSDAVPKLATV